MNQLIQRIRNYIRIMLIGSPRVSYPNQMGIYHLETNESLRQVIRFPFAFYRELFAKGRSTKNN